MRAHRSLLAALLALALAAQAAAQCSGPNCHTLSGQVSDATVGPLLGGHVYVATGVITVPAGSTLTVQPGAVVKSASYWNVAGVILADGTAGQPIVFTSTRDDSAGGDTNGDGNATTPAKGNWRGLLLGSTADGSQFSHCDFRYGGAFFNSFLRIESTGVLVSDCTFDSSHADAVECIYGGQATVSGCHVSNVRAPFRIRYAARLADFTNNTSGSGNTEGDVIVVTDDATLTGAQTLTAANMPGATGAVVFQRTYTVAPTGTLTLEAGVCFKYSGAFGLLEVDGTLIVNGAPSDPVVFTSVDDNAYGSATGTGTPQPGDWAQITLDGTAGASELHHALVRYAGSDPGAIRTWSDVWLDGCIIEHSASAGVEVSVGYPTITGCSFNDNATDPISQVGLDRLANFSGNTASGNGNGDAVVFGGALASDVTLSPASAFNGSGAFVMGSTTYVNGGVTLTLEPGVIIKADPAAAPNLQVIGTLLSQGAPGNEVVFTSLYDDAHGGDVNNDGATTTPTPGDWRGLLYLSGSTGSAATHTRVRYAGSNGVGSVTLSTSAPGFSDCVIELGAGPALDANDTAPTLVGCAFDACGGAAPIVGLELDALANLVGCTAAGNATTDSLRFAQSNVSAPLAVAPANTLNQDGVLIMAGSLVIDAAGSLDVAAGVTFKFDGDHRVDVRGALVCEGAAGEPVVFTDVTDDWAGDSDGSGGPTSDGTPGSWQGLDVVNATGSTLSHTRVANTGISGEAAIDVWASDITLDHVTVEDGHGPGIELETDLAVSVTNCAFDRCTRPMDLVRLSQLGGLAGNSAAGNSLGDVLRITTTGVMPPGGFVSDASAALNGDGVFFSYGNLSLSAGQTWAIGEGVVFKFVQPTATVWVQGTLTASGSAAEPVVFTSVHDDDFGGPDGNPQAPTPGDWTGFQFLDASDASTLDHVIIRYAGNLGAPSVDLQAADITLCDVLIEHGGGDGIDTNLNSAPRLKNVDIENHVDDAIEGLTWPVLGNMIGVSAADNGTQLDATVIESPLVTGDVVIEKDNVFGSCIVVMVTPATNSTNTLSFGRGVIVKAGLPDVKLPLLDVRGVGQDKTVFTSIFDDEHGGDTNGDGGATGPLPGDWIGVELAAGGVAEHALVRYAGADDGGAPHDGLSGGDARSVRAESCAATGIATGTAENCVAFGNLGEGIAAALALNCTAALNAGIGIHATRSIYCVSWSNGPTLAENYFEVAGPLIGCPSCTAYVIHCIGSDLDVGPQVQGAPGLFGCPNTGWGNVIADPLFVDMAAGDLRLSANSPARNYTLAPCPQSILDDPDICTPWGQTGLLYPSDPPTSRDFHENSRRSDDQLLGPLHKVADLGAHERVRWTLDVDGTPELGEAFTLTVNGPPGNAIYLLGLPVAPEDDAYLFNWGWLMVDPEIFFALVTLPVGTPLPLAFPLDPALHGFELSFQAAVTPAGNPFAHELTNVFPARMHL